MADKKISLCQVGPKFVKACSEFEKKIKGLESQLEFETVDRELKTVPMVEWVPSIGITPEQYLTSRFAPLIVEVRPDSIVLYSLGKHNLAIAYGELGNAVPRHLRSISELYHKIKGYHSKK